MLLEGCASKEKIQTFIVSCYALARDKCWS